MPFKILHVVPYMHPSAGGPPVVVESFVREANRLGHNSRIISTAAYCNGDEEDLLNGLAKLAPTTFLSSFQILSLLGGTAIGSIDAPVMDADIVHVHTLWSPLNILVRRACLRHRRPYVLMPHGMLDPYSLSVKGLKKSIYLRTFEKRNISCAKRMIYTTAEEERLAIICGLPMPKAELVPLGASASTTPKEELRAQFLARFPQAEGRRTLLFLGRLHHKKGLDRILSCLPSLRQAIPNVLVVIAGDGDAGYTRHLRELVSAAAAHDHVLFTGRLEGELKWASFAVAELFLLPSRQENFAITVAEAMQMGVPVIITDRVNTWPYVKESGAGLVLEESNVDATLPDAIKGVLSNDAARSSMGLQASHYARERLTWQASVHKLLACYDQVISGAKREESRDAN